MRHVIKTRSLEEEIRWRHLLFLRGGKFSEAIWQKSEEIFSQLDICPRFWILVPGLKRSIVKVLLDGEAAIFLETDNGKLRDLYFVDRQTLKDSQEEIKELSGEIYVLFNPKSNFSPKLEEDILHDPCFVDPEIVLSEFKTLVEKLNSFPK